MCSGVFLALFRLSRVTPDLTKAAGMIRTVPAAAAVATVPACSFRLLLHHRPARPPPAVTTGRALLAGLTSLACTIILDLLISVLAERIDIRTWPVSLMYLLAWLVIIPAVLLASPWPHGSGTLRAPAPSGH